MKKIKKTSMMLIVFGIIIIVKSKTYAYTTLDGNYEYSVTDEKATITKYIGPSIGNISMPTTIDIYPVVAIGEKAFEKYIDLTGNLVIQDGIVEIGQYAFYKCTGLNGTISLPESLTTIGEGAFGSCSGLIGELKIPSSVTDIGTGAFVFCFNLSGNLVIPKGVTIIKGGTFGFCTGLTGNLIIPSSVKIIEDAAFGFCVGFKGDLIIPSSVKSIGSGAFGYCTGLTGNLIIPSSVTSIGEEAFYFCQFKQINFKARPKVLYSNIFEGCDNLNGNVIFDNNISVTFVTKDKKTYKPGTWTRQKVSIKKIKKNSNKYKSAITYKIKKDTKVSVAGTATFKTSSGKKYKSGTWTKKSVYVKVHSGKDSLSGIKSTKSNYKKITKKGITKVVVTTYDKAGNKAKKIYYVKIR